MERKKKDLVLIGMPGCGKTAIGKRLSSLMDRPVVDLDEEIVKQTGCSIPEIFAQDGEAGFRFAETKALEKNVGRGRIVATGGGIVTQSVNKEIARGGIIVFIDRPLELIMQDINTGTRPLLASGKERLYRLYEERYDLYCKWADIHVMNDSSLMAVVEKIMKEVERYENYGD